MRIEFRAAALRSPAFYYVFVWDDGSAEMYGAFGRRKLTQFSLIGRDLCDFVSLSFRGLCCNIWRNTFCTGIWKKTINYCFIQRCVAYLHCDVATMNWEILVCMLDFISIAIRLCSDSISIFECLWELTDCKYCRASIAAGSLKCHGHETEYFYFSFLGKTTSRILGFLLTGKSLLPLEYRRWLLWSPLAMGIETRLNLSFNIVKLRCIIPKPTWELQTCIGKTSENVGRSS